MNNKIIKLQQGDYFKWKNLSREDKVKRNKQIAKQYLDRGPSIQNYYNALKAYFGGFNPKNPYLQTGEPIILPGMNPAKGIQTAAKAARTLEDYLKTTKVTAQALEGSSAARSAYATDRYLGGVMFENNLPEAASQIQGHGMAKASTLQENLARLRYILDNGLEKGKTFFTAPLKVSDARIGSALGTGGGKPYFDGHFLITGKPGQMINSVDDIGTIYINDAYENEEALKAAQKMKEYLTKAYPNKVFKLYSEGFKKGGTIKTANARKWKHQYGGLLGKTQEEVDAINNENRNKAKGLFKGIFSGNILPTAQNIGSMLNAAYNGWIEPETTYITGQAPSGGGPKNPKKIIQSVAKSGDKGLNVTRRVDNAVRNATSYLDGDKRHFGGNTRLTQAIKQQMFDEMPGANPYFKQQYERMIKLEQNIPYSKNPQQSKLNLKKFKEKLLQEYQEFKKNGIKKGAEGTKLTWKQKIGNFANSDLGKSVISNGLSFLSNKLFNKSASSNQEIAQAAQEKEQSTIDPIQVAQMIEIAKNQYADPDNPNANGGDIFNSYIKNQITAPILARQQEEHKKRLAAIEQQKNQAKSSAVGTFFNTLAQGGIEYLQNKYGTTEKADS